MVCLDSCNDKNSIDNSVASTRDSGETAVIKRTIFLSDYVLVFHSFKV